MLSQTQQQQIDRVDQALTVLKEHFDTVQIFCTHHENDASGTFTIAKGSGNFNARYGHVVEWTAYHDQRARDKATMDATEDGE